MSVDHYSKENNIILLVPFVMIVPLRCYIVIFLIGGTLQQYKQSFYSNELYVPLSSVFTAFKCALVECIQLFFIFQSIFKKRIQNDFQQK